MERNYHVSVNSDSLFNRVYGFLLEQQLSERFEKPDSFAVYVTPSRLQTMGNNVASETIFSRRLNRQAKECRLTFVYPNQTEQQIVVVSRSVHILYTVRDKVLEKFKDHCCFEKTALYTWLLGA